MTLDAAPIKGLHQGQPLWYGGESLERAKAAMIMMHGRGVGAVDMMELAKRLYRDDMAYLAPQASGNSWYPYGFMEPLDLNEPGFSSAFQVMTDTLSHMMDKEIPSQKVILLGFSQGACLVLEFAARFPRKYGGVVGLSGALIGPDETSRSYAGSLEDTPVFLGCSDIDPHIPLKRVKETSFVLTQLGGKVTERIYPRMGHNVNEDEMSFIQDMIAKLVAS